ncbi:hypothetical protein P280DRAFT_473326 [Massarina eburnea CBS 473.64]|uniref:Mid2 domain-containing protein n=1 Tax=Massarina eburnea CBS 473.64 TaxID=1395130 RepID=A0A6A6RLL9_9PLEO|nr:hypothetical protein P280DRAFT_473326 [Massarina eburnea CBS 473.64]
MRSSLLFLALFASQVVGQNFYWSYQLDFNSTESYDPLFEVCGRSCSDCDKKADPCSSDEFANICYLPTNGETCCKDRFGTSCNEGFYCGYDEDDVAVCCKKGDDISKCGEVFDDTLTTRKSSSSTTSSTQTTISETSSVTAMFSASATVSDGKTLVARPERTAPPGIPSSTMGSGSEKEEEKKDMSLSVKIGIAIGCVVGASILVALVTMFVLHKMRMSSYNKVEEITDNNGAGMVKVENVAPVTGGVGPFEPMREEAPPPYVGGGLGGTVHQPGIVHIPPPKTPGSPSSSGN